MQLALRVVSLHTFLCFRILFLTCGFDMTKFAQCKSETCFRMALFRTARNTHIMFLKTKQRRNQSWGNSKIFNQKNQVIYYAPF